MSLGLFIEDPTESDPASTLLIKKELPQTKVIKDISVQRNISSTP